MDRRKASTDIHRSVRFFYLQKHLFGDRIEGHKFARTIKGKMIIMLNDCKEMRDIFSEFNISTTELKYTPSRKKEGKKFVELIITNY
ncbi:hypothetical protein [Abyssogena phaseoliformis symbiont]|uniref:hypothetical protein n=1 Tax=Abyssogena phaseoliformis symbiont TaxID=596095 RepID=UPI0019166EDB|nr:hypothetical protein [Abyssogena phaseoliformis symbiont]